MLPTTDLVARGCKRHVQTQPRFGHNRDELSEGHARFDDRGHPLERVDQVDLLHAAQVDDHGAARGGNGVAEEVRPARADRNKRRRGLLGEIHELLHGLPAVDSDDELRTDLADEAQVPGVAVEDRRVGAHIRRPNDFC